MAFQAELLSLRGNLKKIVVTGAAGFIGSHLCRRLSQNFEAKVVGIDNFRSGDLRRVPDAVEMVVADIESFSLCKWDEILEDTDVVYHLAAEKYNSSRSTPEKLLLTNVDATQRLARAAAVAKVGRFVFASSLYSYGSLGPKAMSENDVPEPSTLYGASKLMGEGILRSMDRELGLSWNVARLFFIYGPWQFAEGGYKSVIVKNFERALSESTMLINGNGDQSLDYVYIDDCVEALISLGTSTKDRRIVNVASGQGVAVKDLVSEMSKIANLKSSRLQYVAADWTDGSRRVGVSHEIERHFGWKATTPLEVGLERVWNWMTKQ